MTIEIKKDYNLIDYKTSLELMKLRVNEIANGSRKELLWFLNHDHIYTQGTSASKNEILKKNKTGALFVIEKNNSLDFVRTTGDELNCIISAPVIESIFFKNSPLHDGAVIIEGNYITGSRIVLPVSENENINSRLGLRHRAALGITEKTDAIAVVISEENGKLSLVKNGELKQIKSMGSLNQIMGMMPGMNRKLMKGMDFDDKKLIWTDAIISSMTFEERKNPIIIDGSRRSRISKGSGRTVQEINQLLKQFTEMKKMMKKMGKMKLPKNLKNQMLGLN